jgi:hypothetical protein
LFNLAKDLGEANNLAASMPDKTNAMFGELSEYLKAVKAETLAEQPAKAKAKGGKGKKKGAKQ